MRSFLLIFIMILPLILSGQFKSFYPENNASIPPRSSLGFRTRDGKAAAPEIRWHILSDQLERVEEKGEMITVRDVKGHIFFKKSGLPAAFLTVSFLYRHDASRQYVTVKNTVSDSTGYFHLREKTGAHPYLFSVVRYD